MIRLKGVLAASVLVVAGSSAHAQNPDPSGHWEGAIKVPDREVIIEVDLAKMGNGQLGGTFGNIGEKLRGFPLSSVSVDGRTVRFAIKANSGGGSFDGLLAPDGKSISGKFATSTPQGEMSLPFSLTRTGDAKIDPPVKNAPIGEAFTGTWNGPLDVGGTPVRLVLKLTNQPDGTSVGSIVTAQEGVEIPITTIVQKDSTITLTFKITGATYAATLNAEHTQLTGTWTQGSYALPLTFMRQ